MVQLSKYQSTYEDGQGRTWYSEKWVAENIGYDQVHKMKTAEDLVCGLTHRVAQRAQHCKVSGEMEMRDEWLFNQLYVDEVKKKQAYERTKRRTGKYKVNGKDYAGYILCYFARGLHDGLKRLIIAHTNAIETYLNSRRCVVVDEVVICKKIDSSNRKYIFQMLHEFCDEHFKEEEVVVSNKTMFETFLGQDAKHQVVIKRPPSQHTYNVDPKYDIKEIQAHLDNIIEKLIN